ncbi:hypothetical protein AVEN_44328-1 [Araneus ventricosus]|uniref:Uncharacterized protein n=1 Tax=Araneus ventricosus TaxID=182803 RepID=A0A4Y2WRV6_ARAVE|nr:hypothetical protein AVEN_44328-1 [Araneus ventricosus]
MIASTLQGGMALEFARWEALFARQGGTVCPTGGQDLLYGGKECNEIGLKFSPDYYLSTTIEYPVQKYLCRFKILNNLDCLCGEHGDVDRYLTSCMYTKDYHLLLPTGAARNHWTRKLCKNYLFLNRLKAIFEISRKICEDLQRL